MSALAISRPVSARFDFREFLARRRAVVALWLAYVVVRLLLLPLTGAAPHDPDDWMRLFQVRDFLGGQGWFDVTQYRLDPAGGGASMHWSRLVDLPLIIAVMLFSAVLPMAQAEIAAMIVVPLLYLLVAMLALRSAMLRVGLHPPTILAGLALLPLFPLMPTQFAPMRIDHNVPQAVLALVTAALFLKNGDRAACWAGAIAATLVVVSLEGLPIVAAFAAAYGVRYLLWQDRSLRWFLAILALASAALSVATRPSTEFALPYCDVLLPGHWAAFAAAAAVAFALPWFPAQDRIAGRLAAMGAIPLVSLPVAFAMLGQCAANPFARLDPVLATWWHGYISEGLPIWNQPLSVMAMLVWTPVIVLAGWRRANLRHTDRTRQWLLLAVLALAACLYSFWLLRAALVAQMLAVPFAAVLLWHYMPRARAIKGAPLRILATVACLVLVTPALASAAVKPLDPLLPSETMRAGVNAVAAGTCDYTRLAMLEQGHILAPLDSGPEILGSSRHTVAMASYHRNQAQMKAVLQAFIGPVETGVATARALGADYVVECLSRSDTALYRTAAPDNFANALAGESAIAGLKPVDGFTHGALRVWRVTPDGNPSPRR